MTESQYPVLMDQMFNSDDLLRAVAEETSDAMFVKDRVGRYRFFNLAASLLVGKAASEVLGVDDTAVFDAESARRIMAVDQRVMATGVSETNEEPLTAGDQTRTYFVTKTPYRDKQGRIVGIIGISRDISERKLVEDDLRRSEQLLRLVLDAIPVGVGVMDPQSTIILSNPAFQGIWGEILTSAEERYRASNGWWHHSGKKLEVQEWASMRALTHGESSFEQLIDIEDFTGKRKTVRNSGVPFRDAEQAITGAVVVVEDVTERLRLEKQFLQAQKMEAIGQLAAGVAHDFNNLLNIISGYGELILPTLKEDDPNREYFGEILEAGERAASLTRQLLAFSRRSVVAPQLLDLNQVVRENEKMLSRLIGEDVEMIVELAPDLQAVVADPGLLAQVLMNLAINARDAMPLGGKLTLATRNAGPKVLLSVSDTGEGMSAEVLDHLFEPFFTTKDPGRGTGLGLSTVHGIVKTSGGEIEVVSQPGRGAAFEICLPAVDKPGPAARSGKDVPVSLQGSETILLVEDESALRSMFTTVLQRLGYRVLQAGGGTEAIALCREAGPIDLMVTDVVLPGMGGRELAENLTRSRPGLKVLFMSGYTSDAVVRRGVLQAEVAFLQKPFTMAALGDRVRQLLDAPAILD